VLDAIGHETGIETLSTAKAVVEALAALAKRKFVLITASGQAPYPPPAPEPTIAGKGVVFLKKRRVRLGVCQFRLQANVPAVSRPAMPKASRLPRI
jgi:hypothetical protein